MDVMYKFSEEDYDKLFVTSDTHFNHDKEFVWNTRGYSSSLEMTDDMIEVINKTVGEDGTLLHLGDFCLNTSTEMYRNILQRLKIKAIWMLWGNHNNPIQKSYGGRVEQINAFHGPLYIKYLQHYFTFRRGKKTFVCLHYPMRVWDGMYHGAMHLCGHSHGSLEVSRPENKIYKILDCGWDIHKKPLTMKEIEDIMNTKKINNLHHA